MVGIMGFLCVLNFSGKCPFIAGYFRINQGSEGKNTEKPSFSLKKQHIPPISLWEFFIRGIHKIVRFQSVKFPQKH